MSKQIQAVAFALLVSLCSGGFARAESRSCLDDYQARRKQLIDRMALGTLGVVGDPLATAGGAVVGGAVGVATAAATTDGFVAFLGGMVVGGMATAAAGTTALVAGESVGLARLIATDRMIAIVREARAGQGKHVASFIRGLRKLKDSRAANLSDRDIMAAIVSYDEQGALCDGKLVSARRLGAGKSLRQRLASEHELRDAIAWN